MDLATAAALGKFIGAGLAAIGSGAAAIGVGNVAGNFLAGRRFLSVPPDRRLP